MAKVRSLSFAGKTVSVPHNDHAEVGEKRSVRFDEDGLAEVSDILAQSLVGFYPSEIELDSPSADQKEAESYKEAADIAQAAFEEQAERTFQTTKDAQAPVEVELDEEVQPVKVVKAPAKSK